MQRMPPAEGPDAYLRALRGWRRTLVSGIRAEVMATDAYSERIKWGHIVFFCNGPAALVRAEAERVLFGFWRGQRMLDMEPRLKRGGKYEMATIDLRRGDSIDAGIVRQLAAEAARLNLELGDPAGAYKG